MLERLSPRTILCGHYGSGKTNLTVNLALLAAQAGDKTAQAVVDEYIEDLACGLANLINILQPGVVCLGGGVAKQGEALLVPLRAALDREEFTRDAPRRCLVRSAQLGNDAGIIGGALVGLYR